jgi:hypothetical protein
MAMVKVPKKSHIFFCELCDYTTARQSQYSRHLTTDKHKINDLAMNSNDSAIIKSTNYTCTICNKKYKDNSGLWRHKKKCVNKLSNKNDEFVIDKEFVMMLIKQNSELQTQMKEQYNYTNELQTQMMEVIKNGTHHTNNTNSHNKTFNMHFFLNETCKGAMNIMDFVNSIKVELSDLEKVGKIGYVEGISSIITNNLKALDITQRPIHCTDTKRETLYVKDENKWEKETEEKNKIRKAIKMVANKNIKMLPKFKEVHPDCIKSESKYSNQYNKLVIESFGGDGDDVEKESKIIKNISSVTTIEKEAL